MVDEAHRLGHWCPERKEKASVHKGDRATLPDLLIVVQSVLVAVKNRLNKEKISYLHLAVLHGLLGSNGIRLPI